MPAHARSALTKSSGFSGSFGFKGGASIDTLRMNRRPGRENHSASLRNCSDCSMSDTSVRGGWVRLVRSSLCKSELEQPAIAGARTRINMRDFGR
jgi:hypothetical protein